MTNNRQIAGLIKTAIEAQKKGDFVGAEVACREALALDENNTLVSNQLALLIHFQGQSEAGLKVLSELLEKNPDFPDALFSKGKILFDLGDYKEAIPPLKMAAKTWPYPDIRPWALLGKTFLHLRRYEQAVEWLRPAVKKNPKAFSAMNDLGLALKNVQKHQEAIQVFEQATRGAPGNAMLYFNLGLTRLDLGEHAAAESLFQRAVEIKPDYLEAHEALNETIGVERDDFLSSYTKAIQAVPKNLELRLQYVDTLLRTRNEAAGIKALGEIDAVFGENPRSLWRLAKIQITRDEKTEALATLEKAIGLNPDSIELKLEAAKLLIRLGDYKRPSITLKLASALMNFTRSLLPFRLCVGGFWAMSEPD
ncbi:MAG: tetratricopeptide repeat protein [Sphingomonadales bacterium]